MIALTRLSGVAKHHTEAGGTTSEKQSASGVGIASTVPDRPQLQACPVTHSRDWSASSPSRRKEPRRCQTCGTLMVTSTWGLTFNAPSMAENGLTPYSR